MVRRVHRERWNYASQWGSVLAENYRGFSSNLDVGVIGDDGRVYLEARRSPTLAPAGAIIGTVPTPIGPTDPKQILGMSAGTVNFDRWVASALGTPYIAILRPGNAVWGVADGAIGVAQLDPNLNVAQLWVYANGQAREVASGNRWPWTPGAPMCDTTNRSGRLYYRGRFYEGVPESQLPSPTIGEGWVLSNGEWLLAHYHPEKAGFIGQPYRPRL